MPIDLPLLQKHGISLFDLSPSEFNRETILEDLSAGLKQSTSSHYVNGRWENRYINSHLTPSVSGLLNRAASLAGKEYRENFLIPSQFLGYSTNEYWFNIAGPGESTGRHNHKDEAVISGVFYLKVPENSGDLRFHLDDEGEVIVPAKEGEMVLFPADLDHSVGVNRSGEERISLAFNCYSSELPQYDEQDEPYAVHKYFS